MKFPAIIFFLFLFTSCANKNNNHDGETLAKIHCASCHQFPEPTLLDKTSWGKYILPRMGFMLGVLPKDSAGHSFIEPIAQKEAFKNPLIFRKESNLTLHEWLAIKNYFLENAPEKLAENPRPTINKNTNQFEVKHPEYFLSPPSTTFVKIKKRELFIGDAHSQKLYFIDQKMQLKNMANASEAPVWMNETEAGYLVTSMGSFSPTDAALGQVLYLPKNKNSQSLILVDSLKRPVHTEMADLDNDGRFDLIISEFAKWTGCLAWWKNDGKGHFEKHILRNMPGAMKAYARDINGDNLLDIIALFGQGDEGMFIYFNKGDGTFKEERILRFPPSYGSSYFNLFDHNNDGHLDIIYTNGDNADFPPINKPYHGIRIFENNGKNNFKEIFFYPLHGAYNAIAADFDEDGDLDIAAISFFPDFKNTPEEGFIYLENKGNWKMEAATFDGVEKGRWIVMDAGDLDEDGDLDLILGSLAFEVIPKMGLVDKWVKNGLPYILLENKLNQNK